ncbi:MAG: AIR synthase related protein [bacterium]
MSARPIACTDVLCFGPADTDPARLPAGVLHPARIAEGVIAGVGDYGNKMGIPTVDGAILYDPDYRANPLVFQQAASGGAPRVAPRAPRVGDRVIVIGGHTGRDGPRGATFSSMEMGADTASKAGQLGPDRPPASTRKQVLEVVMEARDQRLYTAITDCGAGACRRRWARWRPSWGPRSICATSPSSIRACDPEIWLSEAQERMVLAVPPAHLDSCAAPAGGTGCPWPTWATSPGTGARTCATTRCKWSISMDFLHDGIPRRSLVATWTPPAWPTDPPASTDLHGDLPALLATPDIASKEAVIRTYDHEVQGGTVVRPLVGVEHAGPSDAAVIRPFGADPAHHRGHPGDGHQPPLRPPRPLRDGAPRPSTRPCATPSPSEGIPIRWPCWTTSAGATRCGPRPWGR